MSMSLSAREPALGWLDRSHTIAKPGFNRWLVPPAALAIHLCIGMSYGLSVFWLPLQQGDRRRAARLLQIDERARCGVHHDLQLARQRLLVTFTIGIVVLGLSAAMFGGWLERAGPRKAGFVAALCWGGGF